MVFSDMVTNSDMASIPDMALITDPLVLMVTVLIVSPTIVFKNLNCLPKQDRMF